MAALGSSDFTLTANGSTQTWSGKTLTMTRPNVGTGAWALGNTGKSTNLVILQAYVNWQYDSTGGNEDIVGISIGSTTPAGNAFDETYSAKMASRTLTSGAIRLWAGAATYNSYNLQDPSPSVFKGVDLKIVYETATNKIRFYFWTGSAWQQTGTEQTYNILNGGSLKPVLFYDYLGNTVGTAIFENVFFDSYAADYSTHYPDSTAEITGALTQSAFFEIPNGSTISWSGTQVTMTRPTDFGLLMFKGVRNSNLVIAQADITWQTDSANEDIAGLRILSGLPGAYNNFPQASITSRLQAGSGKFRVATGAAAWNSYDVDTAIAKNKTVKAVYDAVNTKVRFYYWNAGWTQMGTEQTYNLLASKNLKFCPYYDNLAVTSIGTLTMDKMYFDSYVSDYTTQYPPAATSASSSFFFFF